MPGEGLTHGPPARKKAGGSHHRFSQIIRHSLRDGFNAYSALSLGPGCLTPITRERHKLACLASASGGQDHTPSRPHQRRSSARMTMRVAKASIASRAPRVVTIGRNAPLCERGTAQIIF